LKKYVIISSETIASGEKLEKVAQKKPCEKCFEKVCNNFK